jgi:hypothetical protein
MKLNEIKVGGTYLCKVGGALTRVRVLRIESRELFGRRGTGLRIVCTNLKTGREITRRSPQALRPLPPDPTTYTEEMQRRAAEKQAAPAPTEPPAVVGKEAGVLVTEEGNAVAPGVICRCHEGTGFCPMHGKRRPAPNDPALPSQARPDVEREPAQAPEKCPCGSGRVPFDIADNEGPAEWVCPDCAPTHGKGGTP